MNLGKYIVPLAIVGCLFPNTALAGGTLSLNEIMPLIRQSKNLMGEVNTALKKTGQKADQVTCITVRLGSHFESLSAYRVAPFDCRFASNKFLHIEAKNLVRLPNGRTIPLENFLNLQPKPTKASLVFRLQSWQWKTSE